MAWYVCKQEYGLLPLLLALCDFITWWVMCSRSNVFNSIIHSGDDEKAERKGHQQGEGRKLFVCMYVHVKRREWFSSHGLQVKTGRPRTNVPGRPSARSHGWKTWPLKSNGQGWSLSSSTSWHVTKNKTFDFSEPLLKNGARIWKQLNGIVNVRRS